MQKMSGYKITFHFTASLCVYRKELKKCEFELYDAYCMDIIVSTGEGKVCVVMVMVE